MDGRIDAVPVALQQAVRHFLECHIMEIRIDDASDVSIRDQLAEQIVFSITTGRLSAGQPLPSVRELARRLKIHHNTVSSAYQQLVRRKWVSRRRGSRLIVLVRETVLPPPEARSLD